MFDRFFFRAVELAAVREGVREGATTGAPTGGTGELDLEELSEEELDALRARSPPRSATGGGRDARPRADGDRRASPAATGARG